jgi:hypothetical protein
MPITGGLWAKGGGILYPPHLRVEPNLGLQSGGLDCPGVQGKVAGIAPSG